MFQQSVMDYVMTDSLLRDICGKIASHRRPCFGKRRLHAAADEIDFLGEFGCSATQLEELTRAKVRLGSNESLYDYIAGTNQVLGTLADECYSIRGTPVYVMSRDCPWASFLATTPCPAQMLREGLQILVRYRQLKGDHFMLVMALPLLLILVHPFSDGNGRTMRLVLYKVLRDGMGLTHEHAARYATFSGCSKWAFVQALYEVRHENKIASYIHLFE